MTQKTPIKTALISVADKTGIETLAHALHEQGITILSTGGTAKILTEAGIPVVQVASITAMEEMLDGRVKTLHPNIHGGILARRDDPQHMDALKKHGIAPIDLVVVNLYPFSATLKDPESTRDSLIENIDIGGPAMIRAAAKNHDFVTIATNPQDYATIINELGIEELGGGISAATRAKLAAAAFAHTATYDSMIARWLGGAQKLPPLSQQFSLAGDAEMPLRYGENPHQQAMLYRIAEREPRAGVMTARLIQGKPLSYNNICDSDAAFELVAEFDEPSVAIIKHANPCGVAVKDNIAEAWEAALAADPVSAFGGIIALNRPLDATLARAITDIFTEVIIAPDADAEAQKILAEKPNLRLMLTGGMPNTPPNHLTIKTLSGGFLAQTADAASIQPDAIKIVTKRQPTPQEWRDMLCAWVLAKHVKSNAITFAKNGASRAIGAGQMSRLDACRIAIAKAADIFKDAPKPLADTAVASDAFFPFADGLIAAADAGASAVIQPGGARNDDEVIAAADERGMTMGFTSMRHFRH